MVRDPWDPWRRQIGGSYRHATVLPADRWRPVILAAALAFWSVFIIVYLVTRPAGVNPAPGGSCPPSRTVPASVPASNVSPQTMQLTTKGNHA